MVRLLLLLSLLPACGETQLETDAGADARDDPDATVTDAYVPPPSVYIKASNTGAGDLFGEVALSADGNTLAVGAPLEASGAAGVNGNQADNSVAGAGAVYVFTRIGATWMQQAYLKSSTPVTMERVGYRVAISADGSTVAAGANDAVYVFTRTGTSWSQHARITAPRLFIVFGIDVAISGDGTTLAVGAPNDRSGATGINGNEADGSANLSGAAFVFVRAGATWTQQAYVKASNTEAEDRFGLSVALPFDGSTLAVSAYQEDSGATGISGNEADNSKIGSGAVYLFTRTGTTWSQQAYIKASNTDAADEFGRVVTLSSDGSTLAVGAFGESSAATGVGGSQVDNTAVRAGAAYLFTRSAGVWAQEAYIKASNTEAEDQFGAYGLALSGDGSKLLAGAVVEDSAATGLDGDGADNSAQSAGAAYLFMRSGTAWAQRSYVKASNADPGDGFGGSVALSSDGSTFAVGSYDEASSATGINGNEADNAAANAGAVYVYQ